MKLAEFKDYKENDQLQVMSQTVEYMLTDAINKIGRSKQYGNDMRSSQYACLVDAKVLLENAMELMARK
jgi:hypothetical protein